MKTKYLILLILLSMLNLNLTSQNNIKISGKIVDAESGLPIEFANVYLNSVIQGTVSNNEGNFLLKINPLNSDDSLVISNIGFQTYKQSIKDINSNSTVIFKLTPLTYCLQEVSIKPLPDAKEIVKKAMQNMDINYSEEPFLADCYFSEFIQEDGIYVRAIELALLQYNKGDFPNPLLVIPMQQIKVLQKRKSADNTKLIKSPTNRCFSLNYLLVTSNLRNYFYKIGKTKFSLDSITILGNEPVYVITGLNENEKTTYFITQERYKVIQIDFQWNVQLPKYKLDDYYFSINQTNGRLLFKESRGKLYPAYTSNRLEINYYQNKSDTSVWHNQIIFSELLYTNIIIDNVKEIDKNERLEILAYPNIYKLDIPYNEDYWNNINFVDESINRKRIYHLINDKSNKPE
jgi:hypothetical protein